MRNGAPQREGRERPGTVLGFPCQAWASRTSQEAVRAPGPGLSPSSFMVSSPLGIAVAPAQAEKSFNRPSPPPRPFSFGDSERLGHLPRSSLSELRGTTAYPNPTSHPWDQRSLGNGQVGPDCGRLNPPHL